MRLALVLWHAAQHPLGCLIATAVHIRLAAATAAAIQMWGIIVLHEVQLGMGAVAKLSGGYTEGKVDIFDLTNNLKLI